MSGYAEVVLGLPLRQTFTYLVPRSLRGKVRPGVRVLVPLSQRVLGGFVVAVRRRKPPRVHTLREIQEVLDVEPLFGPTFLSFARKLSESSFSSWGEMLQAALPPSYVPKIQVRFTLVPRGEEALKKGSLDEREEKVATLLRAGSYTMAFLKRKTRMAQLGSLLAGMERKGFIETRKAMERKARRVTSPDFPVPVQLEMDFSLDETTRRAADRIFSTALGGAFSPWYVHGNREKRQGLYFELIRKVVAVRKKALVLVPEISLAGPIRERTWKLLGGRAAVLHSRLTEKQREEEWERIREGYVDVVIGPRSALFSPLEDVGLIVVEEEQDESYLQRESPSYDARKGAWLRAKTASCALVFGSSTPSVELYNKARRRGFLIGLGEEPSGGRAIIVEGDPRGKILSAAFLRRLKKKLALGGRAILFYNRRGYSTYLICLHCRHIPRCSRCDAALRYHRKQNRLICHACGDAYPARRTCPVCGRRLVSGPNFGIEALEEELRICFPRVRTAVFSGDGDEKEQEEILARFAEGRVDVLLGTQVLARRTDVPAAAWIGVLHPETMLAVPDYRASYRTFLMLRQVRSLLQPGEEGELIIQTSLPDHYSILQAVSGDYASFFRLEMQCRKVMRYPPFSHLAEVTLLGENLRGLARESRKLASWVRESGHQVEVLGPALAAAARVRGMYGIQMVLKAEKRKHLELALKKSLQRVKARKTILIGE